MVKLALNALFCIVLLGYLLQPAWISEGPEEAILIHSSASKKDEIRFWKDSLSVKKSVDIRKYQGEGNPVYLLGSDFSEAELLKFMCIRLTARMYFILMLEVQIWQFPLSKRGQGGFFTTKTMYNSRTCIHADTHFKIRQ
ncbi:hypothetical protein [Algoriphagus aquimarinus]|uniref:hypothetical protein n=1 Tax=Algoriphagus aquimarinus TaxID=237018 RepID=UPI0030DA07FA